MLNMSLFGFPWLQSCFPLYFHFVESLFCFNINFCVFSSFLEVVFICSSSLAFKYICRYRIHLVRVEKSAKAFDILLSVNMRWLDLPLCWFLWRTYLYNMIHDVHLSGITVDRLWMIVNKLKF